MRVRHRARYAARAEKEPPRPGPVQRARRGHVAAFDHRHVIGYSIPYDWQGHTAYYFPDFVVRARFGEVFHNYIIEVKGRLDDKDKAKARSAGDDGARS